MVFYYVAKIVENKNVFLVKSKNINMKKFKLLLLAFLTITNAYKAQIVDADTKKKIEAWKQSKLYVVKTSDNDINSELENAVKSSFSNYAETVSVIEADKLMDNDNNFFVTIYYADPNAIQRRVLNVKQNAWDKTGFGIGIFQGKSKKLLKINFHKDFLVRQDYVTATPNMNATLFCPEVRDFYNKTGLIKTFIPEPSIKIMIASTVIGLKQSLDAFEKNEGVSGYKDVLKAIDKSLNIESGILKNKTLLVLNCKMTNEFFNGYAFKKEKIEVNDLSKLASKDKNSCFLIYSLYTEHEYDTNDKFIKQVSVIDCETGKIIYQNSYYGAATVSPLPKKFAQDLNDAINGKTKD